jgi:hypothetical protein
VSSFVLCRVICYVYVLLPTVSRLLEKFDVALSAKLYFEYCCAFKTILRTVNSVVKVLRRAKVPSCEG